MSKLKQLFAVVVFSTIVFSCSGIRVTTLADERVDHNKFSTFYWMDLDENVYQGPSYQYNKERVEKIREIISTKMEAKGYSMKDEQPDLLVGFHVMVEEKKSSMTNQPYSKIYEDDFSFWEGYESDPNVAEVYRFLKGSLTIDIIDLENNQSIWQSSGTRYMNQNPDIKEKTLKKGVTKVLAKFPSKEKD